MKIYTIKRHLEPIIKECVTQYKCVMLTGPRQIGKSTLLENLLPKINKFNVISLDDDAVFEYANSDPNGFLEEHKRPLFIDEVQKAPKIFSFIKRNVDQSDEKGQYVLTGSQKFELMKGANESFSTRIAIIEMTSLSQSEINGKTNFVFAPSLNNFLERKCKPTTQLETFQKIITGSMPDIVNGSVKNKQIFYETYVRTSLFRDVKEGIVDISDIEKFTSFMSILASLVGNVINISKIAKLVGINRATAAKWLEALKIIGVIFYVRPYSNNMLKRVVKSPKLFFFDTGLVCFLTGWKDPKLLLESDFSGHIFECFAISEVVKGIYNDGTHMHGLYFLADVDKNMGREIDLILEGQGGILYPIEIKKNSTPHQNHFKNFDMLSKLKSKVGPMTVISTSNDTYSFGKNKLVLPVHWI